MNPEEYLRTCIKRLKGRFQCSSVYENQIEMAVCYMETRLKQLLFRLKKKKNQIPIKRLMEGLGCSRIWAGWMETGFLKKLTKNKIIQRQMGCWEQRGWKGASSEVKKSGGGDHELQSEIKEV